MKCINGWFLPEFDTLLSKSASKSTHPDSGYQQDKLDAALNFVQNFGLAVDIGANVGFFSTRFSKLFSKVISFEPATQNFDCLIANTKMFENIEIYKLGIGDRESELILELPKNIPNCGAFSFKDFVNSDEEKFTEKIKIITLDSLQINPNFLKIDTQGFEKNVLLGSLETIKRSNPVILAEVAKKGPTQELLDILSPLGYEIAWYSNSDKIFTKRN
jgi:FkbM family methyltransferase